MVLLKVGGFWAGKFEVTQKQYQKVAGSNPSSFVGDTRPVDGVSWNDAVAFCKLMTEQDTKELKIPGDYYYTLPTEAEWESLVADSSVENSVTSMGGTLGGTSPVGSKPENSLGLCDVRGNVAEFTLGDTSQAFRVLRGGSWQDWIEVNLRLEFRVYCQPDERKNTFGFRCILKPK
jgi:formylglycine-generating enzyme required for sulfatase activity